MKGNPFLGQAVGRLGDTVFYQLNGEMVGRTVNPHPHNPRTEGQILQRVVLKTASCCWPFLRPAAEFFDSFPWQNMANEQAARNAYLKANIGLARAIAMQQLGDSASLFDCDGCNWLTSPAWGMAVMPWQVSRGSLSALGASFVQGESCLGPFGVGLTTSPSYDEVATALGVRTTDWLVFFWFFVNDLEPDGLFTSVLMARLYLTPASGDTSLPLMGADGSINDPSPTNLGKVFLRLSADNHRIVFSPFPEYSFPAGEIASVGGCACVHWRQSQRVYYSSEAISLRPYSDDVGSLFTSYDMLPLRIAAASFS